MKPKILRIQIQISFLFSGKVTVYLGKRDFIDGGENVDPIDGVVVVDNDYLRGRKVYGRVTTTYRYGREEDEVMGLKFSKELVLASQQIVPSGEDLTKLTPMQVKRAFVFENLLQNSSFAGK
jgi:arrestin-2